MHHSYVKKSDVRGRAKMNELFMHTPHLRGTASSSPHELQCTASEARSIRHEV